MNQAHDEVTLVLAAQGGDKQAFNRLVDRYESMAQRVALHMLGDAESARDLTQESILQAYLSLGKLRREEQFGSWLYGIVLNVCRSYRRSRKVNFLSLEALAGGRAFDALPFTDPVPAPHAVVEMRELHGQVLAAVDALSPRNREATLLFYYEEMSLQEIAMLLGISVAAVKGRLHKSRVQLREALLDMYMPIAGKPIQKGNKETMIRVTVTDVVSHPENDNRVVILTDEAGEHILPIWIGPFEGESIGLTLMQVTTPRPLTYEFMAKLLEAIGAQLTEVRIEAIRDNTFYAVAKIRSGDQTQEIDARPSDAIALALRMDTPILVAPAVMDMNSIPIPLAVRHKVQPKGLDALRQLWAERHKALPKSEEEEEDQADLATQRQAAIATEQQRLIDYLFGEE